MGEPNTGVVPVPDLRLDKLAEIVNPQRVIPTTMEFVDIAGLVEGASKGEGLGNKFLATSVKPMQLATWFAVSTTKTLFTLQARLTHKTILILSIPSLHF